MGGGTPAKTTEHSVVSKDPYGPAKEYFPTLYERGAQTLAGLPENYVAGPVQKQVMANEQLYNLAGGAGSTSGTLLDMAQRIASGEFLDPSRSSAYLGAQDAVTNQLTRGFTEKILPNLTNTAIQAGGMGGGPSAFGGASLGVPQAAAVNDWTTGTGDVLAKMALDYSKWGGSLMPVGLEYSREGEAQRLMPAAIAAAAGSTEQGWNQGALNNDIQKFQMGQTGLMNFINMLTAGNYGTNTTDSLKTQTAAKPDAFTQALQAAGGIAGIVGAMYGVPAGGGVSAASNLMSMFRGSPEPQASSTSWTAPGYV